MLTQFDNVNDRAFTTIVSILPQQGNELVSYLYLREKTYNLRATILPYCNCFGKAKFCIICVTHDPKVP